VTVGLQWLRRFLGRHPELASVMSMNIEGVRIKGTSPERLKKWFMDLGAALTEYQISPENLYNMDESGFAIGDIEASKVIINAKIRQKFQAKWSRQEWVTSIECICADGTFIPPLIIFKGKNVLQDWVPDSVHDTWAFSCNTKGWTSNRHGLEWLERCFEPATHEKAGGKFRMLICDGHDSHITGDWIGFCMDHDIALLILPPHSSHRTQPLDVAVFGPLKRHMGAKLENLRQLQLARLGKGEWTAAFAAAHDDAFTSQNIKAGFRGTGINPFLPSKLLLRTPSVTPEPEKTPSLTPSPVTPFPNSVLTSSPMNLHEVHTANSALSSIIESTESISLSGKEYFNCLVRSSNRLRAEKAIIEKEKDTL
jgi:hypothetical protein